MTTLSIILFLFTFLSFCFAASINDLPNEVLDTIIRQVTRVSQLESLAAVNTRWNATVMNALRSDVQLQNMVLLNACDVKRESILVTMNQVIKNMVVDNRDFMFQGVRHVSNDFLRQVLMSLNKWTDPEEDIASYDMDLFSIPLEEWPLTPLPSEHYFEKSCYDTCSRRVAYFLVKNLAQIDRLDNDVLWLGLDPLAFFADIERVNQFQIELFRATRNISNIIVQLYDEYEDIGVNVNVYLDVMYEIARRLTMKMVAEFAAGGHWQLVMNSFRNSPDILFRDLTLAAIIGASNTNNIDILKKILSFGLLDNYDGIGTLVGIVNQCVTSEFFALTLDTTAAKSNLRYDDDILKVAIQYNRLDLVRIYLSHHLPTSIDDFIRMASAINKFDIVRELLDLFLQGKTNVAKDYLESVFIFSAANGHVDIVSMFLLLPQLEVQWTGTFIKARDWARKRNHTKIVDMIEEYCEDNSITIDGECTNDFIDYQRK